MNSRFHSDLLQFFTTNGYAISWNCTRLQEVNVDREERVGGEMGEPRTLDHAPLPGSPRAQTHAVILTTHYTVVIICSSCLPPIRLSTL